MRKLLGDQKGFTMIEMLIVMSIIGILSMVAVPRFANSLYLANTAKVQSDLQVLNTSIVMYQAQNGKYPSNLTTDMNDYIVDISKLKPPAGKCFLRDGSTLEISDTSYQLAADGTQALCQGHTLTDFGRKN